jgi:hypothetical protein
VAIETVPVHRAQWTDLVLRMDIPAGRKAVAFALAKFANPDGTRVFPGQGKVADMARLHESNAHKHIKALLAAGMLIVVKRGGGRGGATNTYRLTRPADISTLPLWLDPEMNRIENDNDGDEEYPASALGEDEVDDQEHQALALGETPEQAALALGVSVDNPPETPVDNPETPSADAGYSDRPDNETPIVLARNTHRFGPEYQSLALPDLPKTNPRPTQHHTGSPKATASLALVPPIHNDDETTTEPEPPEPPPADDELDTARAVLAAMRRPVADAWRAAARRKLEDAGLPLTKRAVEICAAELATAPAADTATA